MAGTIPFALSQQLDINGKPLAGCLLYIYQVGTVATLQNAYQDYGLTLPMPNPVQADQTGRIPMFYLADGQVHVRLTDALGVVIFDAPTIQVIGPSGGGGGGGGGSVDPTTISATGDFKWRPTSETLSGWIKANGTTIGSATSGGTQRANADTQNLFVYLWNNFSNYYCPVSGGRGASGLADFSANKTIGLVDLRGRCMTGLDDMGNVAAGLIQAGNILSTGGSPVTPAAWGGEAYHVLNWNEMPTHSHAVNDPSHSHAGSGGNLFAQWGGGGTAGLYGPSGAPINYFANTAVAQTGISIQPAGSSWGHNNMSPFILGTIYIKL